MEKDKLFGVAVDTVESFRNLCKARKSKKTNKMESSGSIEFVKPVALFINDIQVKLDGKKSTTFLVRVSDDLDTGNKILKIGHGYKDISYPLVERYIKYSYKSEVLDWETVVKKDVRSVILSRELPRELSTAYVVTMSSTDTMQPFCYDFLFDSVMERDQLYKQIQEVVETELSRRSSSEDVTFSSEQSSGNSSLSEISVQNEENEGMAISD